MIEANPSSTHPHENALERPSLERRADDSQRGVRVYGRKVRARTREPIEGEMLREWS